MQASSSSTRALRTFVAAIVHIAPARAAYTLLLTFAVGLAEGVGLLTLIPLLQLVGIDAQQGTLGRVMEAFRSAFGMFGLEPTLPTVLAAYVAIVAAQSVLQRQQTLVQTRLREHLVSALRNRLYRAMAGTKWVYFSRMRASTFGQLLTERVERVATAAYYLMDVFVTAIIALVYMLLALQVSFWMTLLVVTCGALLALALRGQLARARLSGERYTAASTLLHAATFDYLGSMKMAKSYGAEQRHAERFAELSSQVGRASLDATLASVGTRQWTTVGSAILLAVIVYAAHAVLRMSAASLFLLIFLFARLVPRVTSLYEKAQLLVVELPAFESVLEAESACLAAAEPEPQVHQSVRFERTLECRDVTLAYRDSGEPPALDAVTITIAAHSTTAIVGPSGGGKSTIADLIMGLLTPTRGSVLVDGEPLTPERLRSWRERIGYVSQDTLLFHDTVRANLQWARPGASDALVWQALAQANAVEFVQGLPAGLDTVIGDRGVLLSGGERQRLSLARALLRQPSVLILDEATSALDSENERRIQQAIDQLHEQITIIVITHRLSTIRNADVIYVLDRGRVVESGTWTSLTEARGRFHALCDAQGVEGTEVDDAVRLR